ncbi:hypothetical protein [Cohnella fermenti]|uniref:Polyprenyl synthetase n=1 Tax=Cohnella fermenti TaxID=2565925 RepID=A0A4S4C8C8_9BACL|nr:hypothetical protein [Cohnella fermenti]THF84224.1 hypothetical protein E6C55_02720 [Cohnella fermenti]
MEKTMDDPIGEYTEELASAFAAAETELRALPGEMGEWAAGLLRKSDPAVNDGRANLISYLLPYWVGEALGVPTGFCRELAIGNVYAMLHFFILDDAIDGDAGWTAAQRRRLLPLGQRLHGLFYRRYLGCFPAESPIWDRLDAYMQMWAEAMAEEAASRADPRDVRRLAGKAAPVKLCAAALLVRAGKPERIAAMDEAVDLALATLQLCDDYADWRDDLAEPDGNAFLTLARELLGSDGSQAPDERSIRRAIYHRGALARLAELAEEHGRRLASLPECPRGLLEFHRSMAEELRAAEGRVRDEVDRLLHGDRLSDLLSSLGGDRRRGGER